MSILKNGVFAGTFLAAAFALSSGPAMAQSSLATLELDDYLDECDLKLVRYALAHDLTIPDNLEDLTDRFCDCQVVTAEMLQYIRENKFFPLILSSTSEQCQGFSNVLSNVETASIGTGGATGGSTGGGDTGGGDTGGGDTGGGDTGGGDTGGGDTGGGDTGGGDTGGGDTGGGDTGGGDTGGTTKKGNNGGGNGSEGSSPGKGSGANDDEQ